MTDQPSDLPPVWVPRTKSQNPMRVAKTFRQGSEGSVHPDYGAVFYLVGRPDDNGHEPVEVVAFDADLAEDLALNLIRAALDIRRVR